MLPSRCQNKAKEKKANSSEIHDVASKNAILFKIFVLFYRNFDRRFVDSLSTFRCASWSRSFTAGKIPRTSQDKVGTHQREWNMSEKPTQCLQATGRTSLWNNQRSPDLPCLREGKSQRDLQEEASGDVVQRASHDADKMRHWPHSALWSQRPQLQPRSSQVSHAGLQDEEQIEGGLANLL